MDNNSAGKKNPKRRGFDPMLNSLAGSVFSRKPSVKPIPGEDGNTNIGDEHGMTHVTMQPPPLPPDLPAGASPQNKLSLTQMFRGTVMEEPEAVDMGSLLQPSMDGPPPLPGEDFPAMTTAGSGPPDMPPGGGATQSDVPPPKPGFNWEWNAGAGSDFIPPMVFHDPNAPMPGGSAGKPAAPMPVSGPNPFMTMMNEPSPIIIPLAKGDEIVAGAPAVPPTSTGKAADAKKKPLITKKTPVGEMLVSEGVINQQEYEFAKKYQADQARDKSLGEVLTRLNLIKDDKYGLLVETVLKQLGAQNLGLDSVKEYITFSLLDKLPFSRFQKENFVPLRLVDRGGVRTLDVFIEDEKNLFKLDELGAIYGVGKVRPVGQYNKDLIKGLFAEIQKTRASEIKPAEGGDQGEITVLKASIEDDDATAQGRAKEDGYISKMVDRIIYQGVKLGASDIHVEYGEVPRVRYRVDGILQEGGWISTEDYPAVVSRFKIISDLDISERRVPQDGAIRLGIEGRGVLDFRVSTIPVAAGAGEKIVLRILDGSKLRDLGIDQVGMPEHVIESYLGLLQSTQGMILITGPTGSGKSTTLYSSLYYLLDRNGKEINICTAEDPIEYKVEGINQSQLNEKQGLTFGKMLKAFLRQDPDIILVGEIRDLETAELGIKAAQTGHLVLSTLHTNTSVQTIGRLSNMGVPGYLIGETVLCIFNQRLARRIHKDCRELVPVVEKEFELMIAKEKRDAARRGEIYSKGEGCAGCGGTGYKGRCGYYEYLRISRNVKQGILAKKSDIELLDIAHSEGYMTMREYGMLKAEEGVTTLEQVHHHTVDPFAE